MAEDEGNPIGFLLVTDNHIDMLFVDPPGIGKGAGSRLLQFAEQNGARTLECFRDNHAARRFYERHGWRLEREYDRDFAGRSRSFVFYVKEERRGVILAAVDPGATGRHIIVEQNQVGAVARRDTAQLVIEPQKRRGIERGHAQRVGQRNAETPDRIANGARHVEIGARKRPVRCREPAVLAEDRAPMQIETVRSVPVTDIASVTSMMWSVPLRRDGDAQRRRRRRDVHRR